MKSIPSIISGIVVAAMVAIGTWFLGKSHLFQVLNAKKLRDFGVDWVSENGKYRDWELDRLVKHAKKIKIYYTSGKNFFEERFLNRYIASLKNFSSAPKVQVILASPESEFVKLVDKIEREGGKRYNNAPTIKEEIYDIVPKLKRAGISVKQDSSLFVVPYLIMETTKYYVAYVNLCFPPNTSDKSLRIVAKYKKTGKEFEGDDHLIFQLCNHFDKAWENAKEFKPSAKPITIKFKITSKRRCTRKRTYKRSNVGMSVF